MQMMLKISLISDALFGSGDSVPGYIDTEIEYDVQTGLPFIRGKTLKGLLQECCADLLYLLHEDKWSNASDTLFGIPGSDLHSQARIHIGDATFSKSLQNVISTDILGGNLKKEDVLDSLTTMRKQTSINPITGVADTGSLRTSRVLIRGVALWADIEIDDDVTEEAKGLFAACIKTLRRGGSGRNRGLGRLNVSLTDAKEDDVTDNWFDSFKKQLTA